MSKELKDFTFHDLVEHYTNYVLTKFIEEGGAGLKNAIWLAMNTAIQWEKLSTKKKK